MVSIVFVQSSIFFNSIIISHLSTSITNRVWYGFGAPQIKKIVFGPLYCTQKMMNIDMLGVSNRRSLTIWQPLTDYTNFVSPFLKYYGDFCFRIQTMRLMVEFVRAPPFFCFFFQKNKKARPREKWCGFLFFLFCLYLSSYYGQTPACWTVQ